MWKQKLALGLSGECGVPLIGQLRLIRAAGFEGFFAPWESAESLRALAAEGAALGLDFQSVHAPFKRTAALWHEEEAPARQALEELVRAIDAALPKKLVLDMGGVTFMDSSGIALILRAQQRMQLLEGSVVIRNIPAQAKRVLDAAGIGRLVSIK